MNAEIFWLSVTGICAVLTLAGAVIVNVLNNKALMTNFMTRVDIRLEDLASSFKEMKDDMKADRLKQESCVQKELCQREMDKQRQDIRDLWEKKADKK